MPSSLITPAGAGYINQYTGTYVDVAVTGAAPPPTHNDGNYAIDQGNGTISSYTTSGWPTGIGAVLQVREGVRQGYTAGGNAQTGVGTRIGGVNSGVSWPGAQVIWTDTLFTPALHPGGTPWIVPDCVNSTEIFIYCSKATNATYCSSAWLELDWAPASGGYLDMLFSLGPFVALALAEMPRLAHALYLRTRGRTRIWSIEYDAAWRELVGHRYPRYCFL